MDGGRPLSPEAAGALDDAPCGLLRTDADGLLLRANRTFCAWMGYEAGQLVGQRKLQDLLTMGGRIFHQTHWAPLLQMQGSVSEVKVEMVHSGGHVLPMMVNALRHELEGVTVHELAVFVAHDRDKYERELVHARKKLEAAVEEATRLQALAKDRALFAEQMIGIVSHDLRNPLSTIQMGAQVLARSQPSESQQRVLERILRAGDRAGRLIRDLLDFTQARMGSGLSMARTPVDVHAVVADALDELGQAFPGRALRHERLGQGACPADADRLAQLVGNLVANAMAYGDPRAPVTVTSAIGDGSFTVEVHNEGEPIPPGALAALFQPMTRGAAVGAGARSVGLGLFIVSEIAKSHGGGVTVRSAAGEGTTFSATFKRA